MLNFYIKSCCKSLEEGATAGDLARAQVAAGNDNDDTAHNDNDNIDDNENDKNNCRVER